MVLHDVHFGGGGKNSKVFNARERHDNASQLHFTVLFIQIPGIRCTRQRSIVFFCTFTVVHADGHTQVPLKFSQTFLLKDFFRSNVLQLHWKHFQQVIRPNSARSLVPVTLDIFCVDICLLGQTREAVLKATPVHHQVLCPKRTSHNYEKQQISLVVLRYLLTNFTVHEYYPPPSLIRGKPSKFVKSQNVSYFVGLPLDQPNVNTEDNTKYSASSCRDRASKPRHSNFVKYAQSR